MTEPHATSRLAALQEQVRALEAKNRVLRGRLKARAGRVPPRPWCDDNQPEAPRGAPWWAVRRMGPEGSANHGPMFRHASFDLAEREADHLAVSFPGAVFVVLEAVAVRVVGEAEVRCDVRAPVREAVDG